MNQGALETLNDDAALQRIASGTLSKTIAAEYGVSPYAVRKRLAKHPDYQEAIRCQAESFVEDAMEFVEGCDAETVAIARVRVDSAFKWAAARDPERWGQRTSVSIHVELGPALQEIAERMRERVVSEQQPAVQQIEDNS